MTHAAPAEPEPRTWNLHLGVAAAAAVMTAVLALGAETQGLTGLAIAVGVVQAALIVGWLATFGIPGQTTVLLAGAALICAAVAVTADVALVRRHAPRLSALVGILAVAFVAVVVQQLARRAQRRQVAAAMAGVATLAVFVASLGGLIVLHRIATGSQLLRAAVLAAGAALVVGRLVDLVLPVPAFAAGVRRGLPGLVLGAAAGTGVAVWRLSDVVTVSRAGAAFLGVAVGLVAGLVAVGSAYADITAEHRALPWLAGPIVQAAIPFALTAPVAYVIGQVVGS